MSGLNFVTCGRKFYSDWDVYSAISYCIKYLQTASSLISVQYPQTDMSLFYFGCLSSIFSWSVFGSRRFIWSRASHISPSFAWCSFSYPTCPFCFHSGYISCPSPIFLYLPVSFIFESIELFACFSMWYTGPLYP